ncbi:response regulator [Chloroflexota bacterium]
MGAIKVLLVDDDEEFTGSLKSALESKSYVVGIAANKSQAHDLSKHEKPDLIILGTIVPRGDAFQLHKWLRQSPDTCDVSLIVIDAAPAERETKGWRWSEGMQLEADEYLSKPISIDGLMPKVEGLLEEKAKTIKVLIVDDHAVVREGVCALLGLQDDIQVIGEAVDGQDAIEKVGKLTPDVVLMDIAMPIMNGLEATKQIMNKYPETKILILTQHDEPDNMYVAKQIGAQGFIPKRAASSDLTSGIRAVDAGRYFPKSFAYVAANWDDDTGN